MNDLPRLILAFQNNDCLRKHLISRHENHRILIREQTDIAGVNRQDRALVRPHLDLPSSAKGPLEDEQDPGEDVGGDLLEGETDCLWGGRDGGREDEHSQNTTI